MTTCHETLEAARAASKGDASIVTIAEVETANGRRYLALRGPLTALRELWRKGKLPEITAIVREHEPAAPTISPAVIERDKIEALYAEANACASTAQAARLRMEADRRLAAWQAQYPDEAAARKAARQERQAKMPADRWI